MRQLFVLLTLLAVVGPLAGTAAAQGLPPPDDSDVVLPAAWRDCGFHEVDALGEAICLDGADGPGFGSLSDAVADASVSARSVQSGGTSEPCKVQNEVVIWTDTNWLRVARNLAANPAPCTEYYISIPPIATPKYDLRRFQAAQIRAFGPQFHALADVHLGETGWVQWVAENRHRFSSDEEAWYEAGVEVRRRMAAPASTSTSQAATAGS